MIATKNKLQRLWWATRHLAHEHLIVIVPVLDPEGLHDQPGHGLDSEWCPCSPTREKDPNQQCAFDLLIHNDLASMR